MYKPNFQKREVIVFHHFQRKGYSLFACLGREVVISVLSVATLSSSKAASISDELWRVDSAETTRNVWLADVGVTGARAPLTQSQAARMVTVLSRDDIQAAPVHSVNDLLKYAVGVDVRQRGALGSQTDISIRGGTQEQIIILLNGVNICDPQTGHNVLDLPVQLGDIQRIEVIEGPAGRLYGTSSLLGAINIVTVKQQPATVRKAVNGEWTVEGGSFGYAKTSFVARLLPAERNFQSLSGSYAHSDGFSRSSAGSLNTGYSGSKAFYQGHYTDENCRLSWYAGIADKGWGSATFYATPRWQADDQYEHTTKLFTALQAEAQAGLLHLSPTLYFQQHYDRYEGYRGKANLMPYNYNRCGVYGLGLNTYFDWFPTTHPTPSLQMRTALGAEMRNEDLVSTNLGEPLSEPHHIKGTDRDYIRGINRTNMAAHLEHNILLRNLSLSAGFVASKNSWNAARMTLYPGIDVSLDLPLRTSHRTLRTSHLRLFASYNTSLRQPSFTEMYYKLQGYAANPHLKPEEMRAVEVGVHLLTTGFEAKVNVYHHHGRNMIDWIVNTADTAAVWQSVNHTRVNSYGTEASLCIRFRELFGDAQDRNFAFSSLQFSYSYISQNKRLPQQVVSQYALEYLRHKFVARLTTQLWRHIEARLDFRWQDRYGTYTDFLGEVHAYRPFALLDARLQWTGIHHTHYLQLNNLSDNRHYVDYGNVPQPGCWAVVGTQWRF